MRAPLSCGEVKDRPAAMHEAEDPRTAIPSMLWPGHFDLAAQDGYEVDAGPHGLG
jgi:hypothetical protein